MKTKFDSIVKVKKQTLDESERELKALHARIYQEEERLQTLSHDLTTIDYPHDGNFGLFMQQRSFLSILHNQIDTQKTFLANLEKEKEKQALKVKKDRIEYEKMKYLKTEEIKKIIKNKNIKEMKEMDEIAIMLYKNREE